MYFADCSFQWTKDGLTILPPAADPDCHGELRVTFTPTSYYAAERDTGQGADFDARIHRIEIRDANHPDGTTGWKILSPRDKPMAEAYLDANHRDEMWDQAFAETEEWWFGAADEHARRAA